MTQALNLAQFIAHANFAMLSIAAREQLKVHTLDALGCAIGAINATPPRLIRKQIDDFGGNPRSTLIGGPKTAP